MNRRFWILSIAVLLSYVSTLLLWGFGIADVVDDLQGEVVIRDILEAFAPYLLVGIGLLIGGQLIRVFLKIEDHLYALRYGEDEERLDEGTPPLEIGMITRHQPNDSTAETQQFQRVRK